MQTTSPLTLLVDGSGYLYRAYYALPGLTNRVGEPTGAIYGVITMLRRLLQNYRPQYLAIVFDVHGKTFRSEIYPDYKIHRTEPPSDLIQQIAPLKTLIRTMGFPLLEVPGVEADDVIATLAYHASQSGHQVLIATSDKDLAQLVNDQVKIVDPQKNTLLDCSGVEEKFGVPPEAIPDYLALVGDHSDNLPGVPKVGAKTAVKWLRQYGSLQNIMDHAQEIGGQVGQNLRDTLDQLVWVHTLALLKKDVEVPCLLEDLIPKSPDFDSLKNQLQHFAFQKLLLEIQKEFSPSLFSMEEKTPPPPQEKIKPQDFMSFEPIRTLEQWQNWHSQLQPDQPVVLVLERTISDNKSSYRPWSGTLLLASCGKGRYEGVYLSRETSDSNIDTALQRFLEDVRYPKIGYDLKKIYQLLQCYGIALAGAQHDLLLAAYCLGGTTQPLDLEALAYHYLEHASPAEEGWITDLHKQAVVLWQLYEVFIAQLASLPKLKALYEQIEMPLVPVLAHIESLGVLVDCDILKRQSQQLAERMETLTRTAYDLAETTFNLDSPAQLREILFDKMKLPIKAKTPKGQPSTAESILVDLAVEYPLPAVILEYRTLSKLKSTYTDPLPQQVCTTTQRIHTQYHQAGTSTGRLSSSDPNLQNIPVRTPEGRRIREAFVAPSDFWWLSADYSQIELRLMAHFAQDEPLLNAFREGKDIHAATAAELFHLPLASVTKDQRRGAKAINFGLLYGMSAFGLARELHISQSEAKHYMDSYFQRYPGVARFMAQTREQARDQGYVETLLGRRIYLPEIQSKQPMRRQAAERAAINAPLQGSAADIIKMAMIAVHRWIYQQSLADKIRMIMQVHDELVFEVAHNQLSLAQTEIPKQMSSVVSLEIPFQVDIKIGHDWGQAG